MTGLEPPPPTADSEREAALAALAWPRRMSPVALVFGLGRRLRLAVRQFGLIVAVAALQAGGRLAILVVLGGVLVTAAVSALAWWRFSFRVERDELVVEEGILSQRRLAVPIGRIQGVSVDQQLTHRVLDVVRVAADTAGSAEDEIVLDAVPRATARDLRLIVLGGARREVVTGPDGSLLAEPAVEDPVLLRRSPRELTVVALTRSPFRFVGAAVGSLVALSSSLDDFIDAEDVGRAVADNQPGATGLALLAAIILIGVVGLSIVGVHLRYHGLELRLTPRGLRTTSGLIERRERLAPLARIQRIRWSANPLQRRLGFSSVAVDQVQAGPATEGVTGGVRLPGTRPEELDEILELHLPESTRPAALDRKLPRAVVHRELGFVTGGALGALVAARLLGGSVWWLVAITVAAIVGGATRVLAWRSFRWGLTSTVVEIAEGPFLRRTSVTRIHKVQSASIARGLFDRRRGLATLVLATASGTIRLPHIELDTARRLRDHALALVESSPQSWM